MVSPMLNTVTPVETSEIIASVDKVTALPDDL